MRAVFQSNLNTALLGGRVCLNDVAPEEQAEMICMAKEGFPTEWPQSVRRARADDVVVIGEQHLLRIMSAYVARRSGPCSSPTGSSATVKPQ
jgi:hypothetical protein